MSITDELLKLDDTLTLHDEGEWSNTQSLYTAFNDAGVECEVGEYLYSLVRLTKPLRALETGTHWGIGASYIGSALLHNKQGTLDTIEFSPEIYHRAKMRIQKLGLENNVKQHLMDVRSFKPEGKYQFMLLDTEPDLRFQEFVRFWDSLDEGGFIFIHDLHRHMGQHPNEEHGFGWPFGKIPGFMTELVRTRAAYPFHFATPRGLAGFYKKHPGDFPWK